MTQTLPNKLLPLQTLMRTGQPERHMSNERTYFHGTFVLCVGGTSHPNVPKVLDRDLGYLSIWAGPLFMPDIAKRASSDWRYLSQRSLKPLGCARSVRGDSLITFNEQE